MIIKIYFCIISSSKNNYIFVPLQQEKKTHDRNDRLQIEYGQTGSMAGTSVAETALTDSTMWSKAAVANSVVRPKRL